MVDTHIRGNNNFTEKDNSKNDLKITESVRFITHCMFRAWSAIKMRIFLLISEISKINVVQKMQLCSALIRV